MRRLTVLLAGVLTVGSTVVSACDTGLSAALTPPSVIQEVNAPLPPVTLAANNTLGTNTYRSPAMAVTSDDTIVVTYDARRQTAADLPNDIDIVERRSTDGGANWSTQTVAVAHTGGNTPATADGVGDSSLLYDRTTRRLFLFYDFSPAKVGIFTSSNSAEPDSPTTVHPMLRHSDDDGRTWSAPVDLIQQVKRPDITGIFASSGHGAQTVDGTLLQPYSYFIHGIQRSAVAYSRDHGVSWHLSPEIGTNLSENKIVQLSDGTLLDDARPTSPGYRMFSHTACITCDWSTPTPVTAIPDPKVNGDLIRASQRPTWLLESNPDSQTARERLTVRLSTDSGATWPYRWVVTNGPAGYSVMAALPDGDYVIAYQTLHALVFQRFTLPQVTGGDSA